MKRKLAALAVCAVAALGVAAPAQATTRYSAAWQAATNNCLRYPGCQAITALAGTGYDSHGCYRVHYKFYTFYGWREAWTGIYCKPPYT